MLINGTISRLAKKKTGDAGDPRDKFTPRATQKNGSNMHVLSSRRIICSPDKDHREATSVLKIKAAVKNSQSKRQKDLHRTFTLDSKDK